MEGMQLAVHRRAAYGAVISAFAFC